MTLAKTAILLLWLGAVLDPIGHMFGIRYISISLATLSIAWLFCIGKIDKIELSYRSALILFIACILPLHGLLMYSIYAGEDEFIDTSYISAGLLIIFSILYRDKDSCLFGIKAFLISTRILSLLIITTFTSQLLNQEDLISFFTERNVALVSFREYSGLKLPYIYYLASPLLILLISYDFAKFKENLNLKWLAIFFLTSFSFLLTGTRAHIIISIFFIPLYLLLVNRANNLFKSILFLFLFLIVIFAFEESRSLLSSFFSSSETSNSMKISLLEGYQDIFSQAQILILGQGFNAHEWSHVLQSMISMEEGASKTELTYLELFRVFGLITSVFLLMVIILTVLATKSLSSDFSWIYPGLVIYLGNAAINPYLFSVNGMLPLGLFSAILFYFKSSKFKKPFIEHKNESNSGFQTI